MLLHKIKAATDKSIGIYNLHMKFLAGWEISNKYLVSINYYGINEVT